MQTSTQQNTHLLAGQGAAPFASTLPGKLVLGLAATAIVAAAAHVSFPLWFTPVPLTMQPLAVLGVGLAFGPVEAFCVMLAYLAEGAAGLPVFSPGGPSGLLHLVGPTGGYLMSYPLVAALTSGITRALREPVRPFAAALVGCVAAMALLYVSGAGWLSHVLHLALRTAAVEGIVPYLPGEAVKVLAAAGIYSALRTRKRI